MYGYRVVDITGGEYRRWFNGDGHMTVPCVPDLHEVARLIEKESDFHRSANIARNLADEYGFDFIELTEEDWGESPLKKLIRKIFGR